MPRDYDAWKTGGRFVHCEDCGVRLGREHNVEPVLLPGEEYGDWMCEDCYRRKLADIEADSWEEE